MALAQWRPNPDDSTEGEWVEPERQEPIYAPAPLRAPLRLEAGERRGFLIHTDHRLGVANRWPKCSDALKLGGARPRPPAPCDCRHRRRRGCRERRGLCRSRLPRSPRRVADLWGVCAAEPTDASPHITLLASRAMPEREPFTEVRRGPPRCRRQARLLTPDGARSCT